MEEIDEAFSELEQQSREDPVTPLDPSLTGESIEAAMVYNLDELDKFDRGFVQDSQKDNIGVHEDAEEASGLSGWTTAELLADKGIHT